MLGALVKLVLYRMLGARIMLGLAIFGWIRRLLGRRRSGRRSGQSGVRQGTRRSAYQPSQGSSQIVQREPR
jgi:hypothetical protein